MNFTEEDWHEAPIEPRYDYSSRMMKDVVRSRLLQKEFSELELGSQPKQLAFKQRKAQVEKLAAEVEAISRTLQASSK